MLRLGRLRGLYSHARAEQAGRGQKTHEAEAEE